VDKLFAKFANVTAKAAGSPPAFLICVSMVLLWAASGPIFKFSETWQLVINTGTTIITFLMVFLIQNTQNRDGVALQTKLDELIRATTDAETSGWRPRRTPGPPSASPPSPAPRRSRRPGPRRPAAPRR
jgi:low affinity Fe/Cu permease